MYVLPRHLAFAGIAAAVTFICGCGDSSGLQEALVMARQVSSQSIESPSSQSVEPTAEEAIESSLPSPHRANPFVYFGEDTTVAKAVAVSSFGQVKVLGFGHVGENRVMLRVGDETQALTAGQTYRGIQVVKITPPLVELKLSNITWSASLFDDKQTQ